MSERRQNSESWPRAPAALNLREPAPIRRWGDGVSRIRAVSVVLCVYALFVCTGSILVVAVKPRVSAAQQPEAALVAEGAPLASVLAHLSGVEGREARIADDISDVVAGSLVGDAASLIELLVNAHHLTVFREDQRVWFDREGRTIVDFVPLDTTMIIEALETLSAPLAPGGTVQVEASQRGLVLSGTRAYVQTSLARIAAATGVDVEPDPKTAPSLASPAEPPSAVPELGSARTRAADQQLIDRVVLVSSLPPRFVELDDGTFLGVGSTLDDGRRLSAIERRRLVFESDGVETVIDLP